jgi:hypothetical protein
MAGSGLRFTPTSCFAFGAAVIFFSAAGLAMAKAGAGFVLNDAAALAVGFSLIDCNGLDDVKGVDDTTKGALTIFGFVFGILVLAITRAGMGSTLAQVIEMIST